MKSDPSKRRLRVRPVFLVLMPGLFFIPTDHSLAQTTTTGNVRQPTITNQFTAATGGALQQRRPGLTVQQGIAVHNGATGFIVGDAPPEQNFIGNTIRLIIQSVIDAINQALSALNLVSENNLFGTNTQTGTTTQPTTTTQPATTQPSTTQAGDTTPTGTTNQNGQTVTNARLISPTHPIPMSDIAP